MFFVLPSTPSSLALDEGGYAGLTQRISKETPLDSYESLYRTSRTLVIPARVFVDAGLDPLLAVRVVSIIYSTASLILINFLIIDFLRKKYSVNGLNAQNKYLILGIVLVFAFLPSRFFWSSVGLRESAMEFWVLSTLGSLYAIRNLSSLSTHFKFLWLFTSITFLFYTRSQVALVMLATILIISIITYRKKFAPAILIVSISSGLLSSTILTLEATEGGLLQGLNSLTRAPIDQIGAIADRHLNNQTGAESKIQTLGCPISPTSEIDEILCTAWRAPYMSLTFLFRPFLLTDVSSPSSFFAALENLLWFFGFLLVMVAVLRGRLKLHEPLLPSLTFFALYVISAGSYEGNMGTAFRHKSLILWVPLIMLLIAYWKKPEYPKAK